MEHKKGIKGKKIKLFKLKIEKLLKVPKYMRGWAVWLPLLLPNKGCGCVDVWLRVAAQKKEVTVKAVGMKTMARVRRHPSNGFKGSTPLALSFDSDKMKRRKP